MSRLRTRRKFVEATVAPAAAALGRISGPNAVIVSDSAPPTVPQNLRVTASGAMGQAWPGLAYVTLAWDISTDNVTPQGDIHYRLYMNGANVPFQETGVTSFVVNDLTLNQQYTFRVSAYDAQGNESAQSDLVTVTPTAWGTVSTLSFNQGVAGTQSFAAQAPAGSTNYIIGTAGQTNVQNTAKIAELAARGITLDAANRRFVYDGAGTAGSVSGVVLEDIQSAVSDWQARISGPGVVWYHNFDSAAEVNAFRWTGGYAGGNDPLAVGNANAQYVQWVASGGADGGGYMQLTRNSSGMDNDYWWRPFNPLTGASNGRGQDDPGANGTIAPQTFIATNGGGQTYNWTQSSNPKHGWYGHSSYVDSRFDGTDFYLQIRVMADPRRTTPGNISVGKFTSFTTTSNSYTAQELVTYGGFWEGSAAIGKANIHNMYRGHDYSPIDSSVATGQINPSALKWAYSGGWDTLLYHITPGLNGGTGANRTRIEVWAAHQGETSYTKIWDAYVQIYFDSSGNTAGTLARNGWNAMLCWIYHNGASMSVFWQKYDQIIFSKNYIECPQA